jgi:hypothetical protein
MERTANTLERNKGKVFGLEKRWKNSPIFNDDICLSVMYKRYGHIFLLAFSLTLSTLYIHRHPPSIL